MADSTAFEYACNELERVTTLERLEARGTVRLALKQTGLEARSVSPSQMATVLDRVLPGELANRGIENADAVCATIGRALAGMRDEGSADTPEAVFQRLGGGA